jgi:integrase
MEQKKKKRGQGEGSVYLRGRIWWVQYRSGGRAYRESAKTEKKTEAIEFLKKKQGEISLGHKPSRDFERTTFEDLKEAYWANFEKQEKRDRERAETIMAHLEKVFKGRKAIDIDEKLIDEYERLRISENVKTGTVNRELSVLKSMFTQGVKRKLVPLDRVPVIEMHPAADPREGFIERDQYEKLLAVAPDWFKPVLSFAFQTGWRRNEIIKLRWDEIDLQNRMITLPGRRSKNGQPRPIYIDDAVLQILQEQRRRQFADGARTFPYVFHRMRSTGGSRVQRRENRRPCEIGDFQKTWRNACKDAGLEGLIFHDLRRSAIREMVRTGYNERTAMEVSGHRSRSVFDHYNIVDLKDQRIAAERRQVQISGRHNLATI